MAEFDARRETRYLSGEFSPAQLSPPSWARPLPPISSEELSPTARHARVSRQISPDDLRREIRAVEDRIQQLSSTSARTYIRSGMTTSVNPSDRRGGDVEVSFSTVSADPDLGHGSRSGVELSGPSDYVTVRRGKKDREGVSNPSAPESVLPTPGKTGDPKRPGEGRPRGST